MLYNKNNVRKTNDKKILHKVGKQWKVISVALLMAIGGGAAVATHANAQTTDTSTDAEVAALEQKPAVQSAQSATPSSASAKSASAKSVAPSSVSYLSGSNGSAASYHAKALNDNSAYNANDNIVKRYVNSLNAKFPSATSSLNNNYNSASIKAGADKSAAQSYSAIAGNKNYSSEVNSMASSAGQTPSDFVQSVEYQYSAYTSNVSATSVNAKGASVVNSYAKLINRIQNNKALSAAYTDKAFSANVKSEVAATNSADASLAFSDIANDSSANDEAYYNALTYSTANSAAEKLALTNSYIDAAFVNSVAAENHLPNSVAVSSAVSSMANSVASAYSIDLGDYYNGNLAGLDNYLAKYEFNNNILDNALHSNNPLNIFGNLINGHHINTNNNGLTTNDNEALSLAHTNYNMPINKALSEAKNEGKDINTADLVNKALAHKNNPLVQKVMAADPELANAINSNDTTALTKMVNHAESTNETVGQTINEVSPVLANEVKNNDFTNDYINDNYIDNEFSDVQVNIDGKSFTVPFNDDAVRTVFDTAVMDNYNANKVVLDRAIASGKKAVTSYADALDAASASAINANNAYASASSEARVDDILGDNPSLADIYGTNTTTSYVADSTVSINGTASSLASSLASSAAKNHDISAVRSAQNELASNLGSVVSYDENGNTKTTADIAGMDSVLESNITKNNASATATKLQTYATNHGDVTNFNYDTVVKDLNTIYNNNAASDAASAASSAAQSIINSAVVPGKTVYNTSYNNNGILGASEASAYNGFYNVISGDLNDNDTSADVSNINSDANSVADDYLNAQSASASYASTTDEHITLAGYFAASYANDATSDEAAASDAKNSLDDFYLDNADQSYASAFSAASSAASAEPNDAALADAYGQRVYNYAPKYITTQKTFGLYNVNGNKYTRLATVPAGVRLAVNGVKIAANGQVRYDVNYKGQKGTVNSYPSYVQQTYLPSQNNVSVTITNPSKVYKSMNFNRKNVVETLKAGTVLPNVNIVAGNGDANNTYGGFTEIETPSGNFVSANIAYASVNDYGNGSNNSNNNVPANNNAHRNYTFTNNK